MLTQRIMYLVTWLIHMHGDRYGPSPRNDVCPRYGYSSRDISSGIGIDLSSFMCSVSYMHSNQRSIQRKSPGKRSPKAYPSAIPLSTATYPSAGWLLESVISGNIFYLCDTYESTYLPGTVIYEGFSYYWNNLMEIYECGDKGLDAW